MANNTTHNDTPGGGDAALVRINKALAAAGVCSRRAADELVAAGRVTVNDQVVDTPGARIDPGNDVVAVDGRLVSIPVPGAHEHTYILLNKPTQVVTTASDPEGRRTVIDLLGESCGAVRVFPVGRLDFFSQGLLLLTDDGELANRLSHPSWHLPKVYHVTVRKAVPEATVELFASGMTLAEGEQLAPVPTRVLKRVAGTTTLELTLVQGINRQIRRMCRDARLTILRLERVSQGPITLGSLPEGQARPLTPYETAALLHAVDMGPAPAPLPVEPTPEPKPEPMAPAPTIKKPLKIKLKSESAKPQRPASRPGRAPSGPKGQATGAPKGTPRYPGKK